MIQCQLKLKLSKRQERQLDHWLRLLIRQSGFRCSVTGKRGSTLAAHHLFSVKHRPDKRWDERYVVVILKHLHLKFHSFMGGARVACTPEDWKRFLHDRDINSAVNALNAALGSSVERIAA